MRSWRSLCPIDQPIVAHWSGHAHIQRRLPFPPAPSCAVVLCGLIPPAAAGSIGGGSGISSFGRRAEIPHFALLKRRKTHVDKSALEPRNPRNRGGFSL